MPNQWWPDIITVGSDEWVDLIESALAEARRLDESLMTPQRLRIHHDRIAHLHKLLQDHETARPRPARLGDAE